MLGTIIVLEDQAVRTDWLKGRFSDYQIEVFSSVAPFVKAVDEADRSTLKLVIFDHDLGHILPSDGMYFSPGNALPNYDPDGKTGRDAAREVKPFGCPTLVWSHNNGGGGEAIASLLANERKSPYIQVARFSTGLDYAVLIQRLLLR